MPSRCLFKCRVYTTGNGIHVPTKIIFDFICDYIDGELASSDETSEVIWVPKESVMEYIALPVLQLRFKNILNFDGHVRYCTYVTKPEFRLLSERIL